MTARPPSRQVRAHPTRGRQERAGHEEGRRAAGQRRVGKHVLRRELDAAILVLRQQVHPLQCRTTMRLEFSATFSREILAFYTEAYRNAAVISKRTHSVGRTGLVLTRAGCVGGCPWTPPRRCGSGRRSGRRRRALLGTSTRGIEWIASSGRPRAERTIAWRGIDAAVESSSSTEWRLARRWSPMPANTKLGHFVNNLRGL
jgi:hypothetical protein